MANFVAAPHLVLQYQPGFDAIVNEVRATYDLTTWPIEVASCRDGVRIPADAQVAGNPAFIAGSPPAVRQNFEGKILWISQSNGFGAQGRNRTTDTVIFSHKFVRSLSSAFIHQLIEKTLTS
jgi:hypothetical protein